MIIVKPEQGGDMESLRGWMKLLIGSKSLRMIRGRHRPCYLDMEFNGCMSNKVD